MWVTQLTPTLSQVRPQSMAATQPDANMKRNNGFLFPLTPPNFTLLLVRMRYYSSTGVQPWVFEDVWVLVMKTRPQVLLLNPHAQLASLAPGGRHWPKSPQTSIQSGTSRLREKHQAFFCGGEKHIMHVTLPSFTARVFLPPWLILFPKGLSVCYL